MRTWKEVIEILQRDAMQGFLQGLTNKYDKSQYPQSYKTFIDELKYYMIEFLTKIRAKVVKTDYDNCRLDIIFELKSKLYVLNIYRWNACIQIAALDSFDDYALLNGYKRKYIYLHEDGTNPFIGTSLPKHSVFKPGDVVVLRNTAPRYKYKYDYNKVFKIKSISRGTYRTNCILEAAGPITPTWSYYPESNLKKIENGI